MSEEKKQRITDIINKIMKEKILELNIEVIPLSGFRCGDVSIPDGKDYYIEVRTTEKEDK